MNSVPLWISWLSALLTPVVASLGLWIAFRQLRTAQSKHQLDLFDRRFSIYEAAKNLIASIVKNGKAEDEEVFKFLTATCEARWLLNSTTAEYLRDVLHDKAIDLQTLQSEIESTYTDEDRSANLKNQVDIKKWFRTQYKVLDEKFSPFLKLLQ